MEHLETITHDIQQVVNPVQIETEQRIIKRSSFIEANTVEGNLQEIKHSHIIPVYANNEPLISHADFIDVMVSSVEDGFGNEEILAPEIRVSHPIMGRVPEAKDKRVDQLEEWEKTLYYQKMAFIIEIPSIHSDIDGSILSLTIGGVRSFAEENLSCRSATDQHFRIFIGFKNTVCW